MYLPYSRKDRLSFLACGGGINRAVNRRLEIRANAIRVTSVVGVRIPLLLTLQKLEAESEPAPSVFFIFIIRFSPGFDELYFRLYHKTESGILIYVDRQRFDCVLQLLCQSVAISYR